MKNRFIRMLSILCTIMLVTGLVSVWASAEETAATPTDLTPSREEEATVPEEEETVIPEKKEEETIPAPEEKTEVPEEEPKVPETREEEKKEEVQEPEPPVDSVEVIITKSVRLGETWEGVTRDTKLTVLKLDLDKAQTIHLIVEGKNAWANIRKSEQSADNLRKVEANSETKLAVINLEAEAGSYLITIGPVEPNKMAKAKATILDDQGYAAWEASLENSEEEPVEEPEAEKETEPTEEQPEEPETEPTEELTEEPAEEESGEPEDESAEEPEAEQETEPTEEQPEEAETEPAEELTEEPAEEPMEEEAGEPEEEPAGEPEEELTEEQAGEPEEETTEEANDEDPEEPAEEPEEENEPAEEEPESGRSVDVEIKWDVAYPIVGDTAHFTATLNGYEDVDYTVQWQYSPDKETWYDIQGETDTTMDMVITEENNVVYWRIIVYVEENQEE